MTETTENNNQENNNTEKTTEDKAKFMENFKAELSDKDKNELVEMVVKANNESKTRKFENKDLLKQIETFNTEKAEFEKTKQAEVQTQLEKNQKWEEAYNTLKDSTSDFENLLSFKQNYLKDCNTQIEELLPTMSSGDVDSFKLYSEGQSVDKQLKILKNMLSNKKTEQVVDTEQSSHRINGLNLTKEDLLKDTKLMAKVKKDNPSLYQKFFGMFN